MSGSKSNELAGKRVAIVVADGFEQVEMAQPREALEKAGAKTDLISLASGKVKGWQSTQWGDKFPVDIIVDEAKAEDYDALLLPGGVMSPDKLRRQEPVQDFVRAFFEANKPVAAICHGPWTLIDTGVVRGRKMTSYESIQTDLKNAGAKWVDEEVVTCRQSNVLITSRKPADIPAFNRVIIEEFAKAPQMAGA